MPAPGGSFKGSNSDSRGYAGGSSSSSRSGAGGAGGVRNSSSGTRESAGSQARSSGGSTGNTSRGGSSMGGGLASAAGGAGSNGQGSGRPGAGSGPSRAGSNGAAGLAGAARSAYGGGSNPGGLGGLGRVGNVGRTDRQPGAFNGGLGFAAGPALAGLGNRPFGSYAGPKGTTALNQAARMAAARSVGWSAPAVNATPEEIDLMARTMLAESSSIRNAFGRPNTAALQAVGDVVRNRVLSNKYPDTVEGVVTQKKQFSPFNKDPQTGVRPISTFPTSHPDFQATRAVAQSILAGETPSVVGNSLNFGNLDTINNKPKYSSSSSKAAFNSMNVERTFKDAKNPNTYQHSFGTVGTSDVAFGGPYQSQAPTQVATGPGASPRVAEFAARGKPSITSSNRVAEFAARGKPQSLAPSNRVAEFAARGKPAVPAAFAVGRAQEFPTPIEISRPWEIPKAQPIPTPMQVNPAGYSQPAQIQAPSSGSFLANLPGLGAINQAVEKAKTTAAPFARMAWDNLNNPLLGLMRSPSRPRSRSGNDLKSREVERIVAALTSPIPRPQAWDYSTTET